MRIRIIIPVIILIITACEKENAVDLLTDIDGNSYKTIQIGSQTWMAENLKVTRDKDGNSLETFCYSDRSDRCEEFGRLYPWQEAIKACPEGWKLPSEDDWDELQIYLGMDAAEAKLFGWRGDNQGIQLKEGGSSGFEALLAGYKDGVIEWDGRFFDIGYYASFWSSTQYDEVSSIAYFMYTTSGMVYKGDYDYTSALSVRCIRR